MTFYGTLEPQAHFGTGSGGNVSVELRGSANQAYLFETSVYASSQANCKFTVIGPDAQKVEFPCKLGYQNLFFAFNPGPSTGDFHFSLSSNKGWYFFWVQIDTQ